MNDILNLATSAFEKMLDKLSPILSITEKLTGLKIYLNLKGMFSLKNNVTLFNLAESLL